MNDPATATVEGDADAVLLARLRAGDASAFEMLVRSHGGRLLVTARRILGNEDDARDAVQDAFLSAFRAVGEFTGASRLSTWLHRIVVNAALARIRSRQRRPERLIDDLLPKFLDDGHQAAPASTWSEPADAVLAREETRTLVRRHIDQLPEAYRTVLVLRDIEEVSTEETANLLGVTVAVVKTRLHRARQALRALLDPNFREGTS